MGDVSMVKVRALHVGQTPEGDWVQPGDEFEVPEDMVSKKWHQRLDADAEAVEAPRRGRKPAGEKKPEDKPEDKPEGTSTADTKPAGE